MRTLAVSAVFGAAALAATAAGANTLNQVKQKGTLQCGSNTGVAGFGISDDKGNWTGLDVDFCRAVAAAIFNDPTKVRFTPLSAKDRYEALKSGEIDVLARNSTWSLGRDIDVNFVAAVNYFDGQGFIVRKGLKVGSARELSGASICVQQGTTTELNLSDYFRSNDMKFEPVVFATLPEATKAYETGRCDAYTTDASGLYSVRLGFSAPDEHIVLPEIISKEPLGPAVRHGDTQWALVVRWTHYAMINAEELGVTQKNVDEKLASGSPEIKRLLGVEGKLGEDMGLTKDWAYRIIKHVGNYDEVLDRNVGEGSRLKIKRGLNALWSKGGLQYAPPIR